MTCSKQYDLSCIADVDLRRFTLLSVTLHVCPDVGSRVRLLQAVNQNLLRTPRRPRHGIDFGRDLPRHPRVRARIAQAEQFLGL